MRFSIVRTLQETTLADLVLGPALAAPPLGEAAIPIPLDTQPRPLTTGA